MIKQIETYSFSPALLAPAERLPGVSAFMRIRNGADFLEATIRSHIDAYDEIVAVYNQCTDATPDILDRLAGEYGPRLRVVHYLPRVHPAGSEGHASTPPSSPQSLVTYYNCALAMTRHQWAVKLDDDHLAIPEALGGMVRRIRTGEADDRRLHCFSGPNLIRDRAGRLGIASADPVSGGGDIGYFRVRTDTYFTHDPRFERFARGPLTREFAGWFYWHLKFLKQGGGFANYELDANPGSRYARKRDKMAGAGIWDMSQMRQARAPGLIRRLRAQIDGKERLSAARDMALSRAFPQTSVEQALDDSTPGWRDWLERAT
ncbi:glycosyltransferase family 2 protein [Roseicyclus mahoneyensis]|uniref:Glycosyltransferase involved in cell wall biosynthesis n=1 Tax=Roseicyclus mahoneyensis TaxID=164332 RepID=A0A316GFH7_9RHOB|nr:glycosyl transferase [Roseicyclus mahoneyensis]PWK59640.1 glycosyltransferase involved in cell wall biosynthesis [Roseicyclus mahoneyensis]